jgi:hypothetical protein
MARILHFIFISILFAGITYAYYFKLNYFPIRIISSLGFGAFYFFIILYFSNRLKTGKSINKKSKILLTYIFTTLIIFVMSFRLTEKDIITIMFHPIAFGAFFIGIVSFLITENSIVYLNKISIWINNAIVPMTTIDILIFKYPIFLIACHTFLLFEFCFAKKRRALYLISCMIVSIPLFAIYDYRSGILLTLFFLVAVLSIYFFKFFQSKLIRYVFLTFSLGLIYFLSFNFTETYEALSALLKGDVVSKVDTRTFLFIEFFEDFKKSDFLFGKGYLGTYYSPFFQDWQGEGGDHYIRFVVEIGFLEILFKGGLVLLIVTLLTFISSIYVGFIKSKPGSIKFMMSIWLLIELGMFVIQNPPAFNPHFFIIWTLIGILNFEESTPIPKSVIN